MCRLQRGPMQSNPSEQTAINRLLRKEIFPVRTYSHHTAVFAPSPTGIGHTVTVPSIR
jgi:hypothetical protein